MSSVQSCHACVQYYGQGALRDFCMRGIESSMQDPKFQKLFRTEAWSRVVLRGVNPRMFNLQLTGASPKQIHLNV